MRNFKMISEIVFEVKKDKVYEIWVGVQGHKLEKRQVRQTGKFKIAKIKKKTRGTTIASSLAMSGH